MVKLANVDAPNLKFKCPECGNEVYNFKVCIVGLMGIVPDDEGNIYSEDLEYWEATDVEPGINCEACGEFFDTSDFKAQP